MKQKIYEKVNADLRMYAASKGVFMWEISDKFGVSENTLYRRLRHPADEEFSAKFREYVDSVAKER